MQIMRMRMPSLQRGGKVDALSASFNVSLRPTLELPAAPGDGRKRFCTAAIWGSGAVVIWGVSQVEEGIDEAAKTLVGHFCSDYGKANPEGRNPASNRGQR